jgi:PKD repeat protein
MRSRTTEFSIIVMLLLTPLAAREPQRHEDKSLRPRETTVFPITATAGFETGVVTLATLGGALKGADAALTAEDLRRNALFPEVDWGDGTLTPALLANCSGSRNRTHCDVRGTHVYDEPGNYTVTIRFTLRGAGTDTVTTTAAVAPPKDFVILSIGDSVASGEGNPVTPANLADGAQWDDPPSNVPPYEDLGGACHRSALAGPALAAQQIVQQNQNATFVHLACSGATLGAITDQLRHARTRLPRIDVLVISGGANDVAGGFGTVVTTCLDPRIRENCSDDPDFAEELRTSIAGLTDKYTDLAAVIDCQTDDDNCTGPEHVPQRVLITEYFDPTRDRNGEFPGQAVSTTCAGHTVAPVEWEFLYDNMVVPLNDQVTAAATTHGWVLVDGIQEAFREHGYCASAGLGSLAGETWIVKIPESLRTQGDPNGTGHPNLLGQQTYRDAILEAITLFGPP